MNGHCVYLIMRKAVNYLLAQQQRNGSFYLKDSSAFDIWETIQALLALHAARRCLADISDVFFSAGCQFLLAHEDRSGRVIHGTYARGYCVETTSEYVRLLLVIGGNARTKARNILCSILNERKSNDLWKIANLEVPTHLQTYPSVTGFAIRALLQDPYVADDIVEPSLSRVCATMNQHGHWDAPWQFYGSPFYALSVLYPLLHQFRTIRRVGNAHKRTWQFLADSQNTDGYWTYNESIFPLKISTELHTALALTGIGSDFSPNTQEMWNRGIIWLCERQTQEGNWTGGIFPHPDTTKVKYEDIFCTSLIMMLIVRDIQRNLTMATA